MKNKVIVTVASALLLSGCAVVEAPVSNNEVAKVPVVSADVPLATAIPFLYTRQTTMVESFLKEQEEIKKAEEKAKAEAEAKKKAEAEAKEKALQAKKEAEAKAKKEAEKKASTSTVQKDGVESETPKATPKTEKKTVEVKENGFKLYDIPLSADLQKYISELSKKYSIDYELIIALLKVESNFNASLVSSTNDYGIAQINQVNHSTIKKNVKSNWDWSNPYDSVLACVYLLDSIRGDKNMSNERMLLAYNMGEGGARKYLRNHSAGEWKYVKKVMAVKNKLESGESID